MNGNKTILFGGSGFLGPIILEKYPEIISVGRQAPPSYIKNRHIPLSDLNNLSVLDEVDFDTVIFLIGNSNHHEINRHPTMGLEYNVWPLKQALHYFKNRRLKKFICFTTILLYDVTQLTFPVNESLPTNPYLNDYVFSKHLSEEVMKFYAPEVPGITVRFSNIYGPTKLVRPDVVPTLIQKVLSPEPATVWNTAPVRDFLFLEDAAEALVALLETEYTGVVNLGSGSTVSIARIAEILEELSGKKITNLNQPVSGPLYFCCDIGKINSLTGWKPKPTIEEGLAKTFAQMQAWAPECRWWEQPKM